MDSCLENEYALGSQLLQYENLSNEQIENDVFIRGSSAHHDKLHGALPQEYRDCHRPATYFGLT
jgi:hypothetical protein